MPIFYIGLGTYFESQSSANYNVMTSGLKSMLAGFGMSASLPSLIQKHRKDQVCSVSVSVLLCEAAHVHCTVIPIYYHSEV